LGIAIGALNAKQSKNYDQYQRKLPRGAEEPTVEELSDGDVLFSSSVPGKVPGSYADYLKTVNADGVTTGYFKVSVAPDGSIISVKDKFNLSPEAESAMAEGAAESAEASGESTGEEIESVVIDVLDDLAEFGF
jgi:hypothetical protein